MVSGKVKKLTDRGFWFIEYENQEGNLVDIFFHWSDLEGWFEKFNELQDWENWTPVEFNVWVGKNGKEKAEAVKVM